MSITVTVADVAALVPEATIPEERETGQKAVIESEVEDWIASLTATVTLQCDGWTRLPAERLDVFEQVAQTIVACGAASYLEAARAPERAGMADTSYAGVLWERWREGLTGLQAIVREWLMDPEPGGSLSLLGGAASFPDPSIPDNPAW